MKNPVFHQMLSISKGAKDKFNCKGWKHFQLLSVMVGLTGSLWLILNKVGSMTLQQNVIIG